MSQAAIDYGPREDRYGKIVFMVRSGGYVMCKRPRRPGGDARTDPYSGSDDDRRNA